MATNPSHILIARNSRGANKPSAALSSPTETHAAAAGIFRSSGSPPWLLEECETDDIVSELSTDDDEEAIEIDEAFTKHSRYPGSVKIIVESTTFWYVLLSCFAQANLSTLYCRAHKEVLFFASPFFEAALSGGWAETGSGRPPSMSSVITISQPPSIPGDKGINDIPEMTFAPMDMEPDEADLAFDSDTGAKSEGSRDTPSESEASDAELVEHEDTTKSPISSEEKAKERDNSLAQLMSGGQTAPTRKRSGKKKMRRYVRPGAEGNELATVRRQPKANGPDAVIVLKEERVCIRFVLYLSNIHSCFRRARSMIS